jgi:hypothetical protein
MTRTRLLDAAALVAALLLVRVLARGATPAATLARPAPGAATTSRPAPGAATTTRRPAPDVPAAAPTPAAGGGPDATTVRTALATLDRARAAAYDHPVDGDPDAWAARTCPCHAADAARLRALARAGQALRGAATRLVSVADVRAGPGAVTAVVTDRLAPYTTVDRRGRAVARWPGTGPRRWRVTLVRVAGRWLLGAIARAP